MHFLGHPTGKNIFPVRAISREAECCELNVCLHPPLGSRIETPVSMRRRLRVGPLGSVEEMRVEYPWWGQCPYKEGESRPALLHAEIKEDGSL